MFKKSQLALILLTLVLMLSVYYIKTNTGDGNPNDGGTVDTSGGENGGRLEELAVMRNTLKDERNTQIAALNEIISSSTSTAEQISQAMDEKNKINELTENELLLELAIMQMGYQDAFVHATSSQITVTVVSDEHSLSKANEIIISTILGFDSMTSNVCVEFQTAEEVMGTVNE